MGSHSSMAQGEGTKLTLFLLVFGGLTVTSAQAASQEEGADNESSESHFVSAGAGANAAQMGNHGKYFQDFYSLQYGPNQLEFGHVCEDPATWEQRFERKDLDKQHHQGQCCVFLRYGKKSTNKYMRRYGHQDKDHYDMGHRRGNEHHFIERHEKGAPHHGHVSTKVRWGDKHGGYGEHYWDYNHGGHHDGDDGDGTAPVAEYAEAAEDMPLKKQQQPFQNGASEVASTSTNTRRRQQNRPQSRHPSPSGGFVAPTKVPNKVTQVKWPTPHVAFASEITEQAVEGRLPPSWTPIPSAPSWNRPLTAHQMSRARRSLQRARNSVETRRSA